MTRIIINQGGAQKIAPLPRESFRMVIRHLKITAHASNKPEKQTDCAAFKCFRIHPWLKTACPDWGSERREATDNLSVCWRIKSLQFNETQLLEAIEPKDDGWINPDLMSGD